MLPFYFTSGYRVFTSYWWKHYLRPSTWYRPFLYTYQRATRGFADCDTWNLDSYLAEFITNAILNLKKNTHGYPGDLNNQEEWNEILDKIVTGFNAYKKVSNGDFPKEYRKELDTSTGWHADLGVNDVDYNWGAIHKWEDENMDLFRESMKLLTERFGNLWD